LLDGAPPRVCPPRMNVNTPHRERVPGERQRAHLERRCTPYVLNRYLSVCVLCGSPVWPSPPVVGPLWGTPLCVGPLYGSPLWVPSVWVPSVWVPCVGPLCGSLGPSRRVPCIYSRDVSRSFTRSRLVFTYSWDATTRIRITHSVWITLCMTWICTYLRLLYSENGLNMNRMPYFIPHPPPPPPPASP